MSGPGVPPTEPGDRVSSLPGPEYESEDDGGRCNEKRRERLINSRVLSALVGAIRGSVRGAFSAGRARTPRPAERRR